MDRQKELESQLEGYLGRIMETHHARGMAVAVIDKGGETHWQRFFGFRDAERRLPIDEDTLFGMASVTKSFTALAMTQLAERGLVRLDDPASKYCPDFRNAHQSPVTLAHFLSHSGGYFPMPRMVIPPLLEELGLPADGPEDLAYSDALAQAGIERVTRALDAPAPRIGEPGEYMSYSNDGYGVLADVIRRLGGEGSYAAFLDKNILRPLGMDRSTCEFLRPARDPNVSKLYSDGLGIGEGDLNFYRSAFVLMGGGAMKSTLRDMKKYLQMYMNEGCLGDVRVASSRGIRAMCRPRIPTRHQYFYGLGLTVNFLDGVTVIRHGGSLPGVSSHMAWSPELERGVIVLCNTQEVPVALAADAALRFMMGRSPEPPERDCGCPWREEVIQAACGSYISGEGAAVIVEKVKGGIAVTNAGKPVEVRMVHPFRAFLKSGMSETEFRLYFNDDGSVWGARLGERIVPKKTT